MLVRFRLSDKASGQVDSLVLAFGFGDRIPLLRLALGLALAHPSPDLADRDSAGADIPLTAATQADEDLLDAMISQKVGRKLDPNERRKAYKQLIDFGVNILWDLYEQAGNPEDFLLHLSKSLEG